MAKIDFKEILDQSWQLRREKKFSEAEMLIHEALGGQLPGSFEHNVLKANLADVQLRQGNTATARETALEVLEKMPKQVTALTVLGMVALENRETAEAVENLQKAYDYAPNPFRAGRLARALELDGKVEDALTVLHEALQKYPRDSYLLKQYNTLQEKLTANSGKADKNRFFSDEVEENNFILYAEQMKAKLKNMEPGEAASQLQKIIKVGKRKENPHLHLLLGNLFRKAGDENAALEAYQKARELDPKNLLALSQLLFTYRRLDKKEESWPLLKLLLDHRPDDKTAKASLLKDAVELGREKEAAEFFEELLQKYPHRKELYGALRKLKKAAENKQEEA